MRKSLFPPVICTVLVAMMVSSGCGKKDAEPVNPGPQKPKKPTAVDTSSLSTELPPQPAVETVEPPPRAPVPAQAKPVQEAVEAFKAKNNRYPRSISELVDQKLVTLPPLPPGKAFFVNPTTGEVVIGNFP